MWRLGVARISHGADERALLQRGAFLDPDRVEVDIEREYALSVVHDDRVAVDRINICFTNQARVYRAHSRAFFRGEIRSHVAYLGLAGLPYLAEHASHAPVVRERESELA